jgi:methanogenic corrinoid protein MtbC1
MARQAEGMSISHAVELWNVLTAQGQDPLQDPATEPGQLAASKPAELDRPDLGDEINELRQTWIDACLAYDRETAEQVLTRAFALFPPQIVSTELLQAGLREVGELWHEGSASVQQEHFTSAMSVQRLEMLIAAAPPPVRPERILVASAQDDYHVFGALLLTFLLRRRGWDVLYLGADVPVAKLEETVAQIRPHMLVISNQLLSTAASLVDVTTALEDHDILIGYGGLVFNMLPQLREHIPAHYLGPTIEGAIGIIEQLIDRKVPPPPAAAADERHIKALKQFEQHRSLIESQVWNSYAASDKMTDQLSEINFDLAGIIISALKFSDIEILGRDMEWIQYLMASYQLTENELRDYIRVYYESAKAHLDDQAHMVFHWLEDLLQS